MKHELLMMRTKGLASQHLTRKAGGFPGLARSKGGAYSAAPPLPETPWMLNLDGTNYMELSEPKMFTGNSELEFVISTTGGVLQDLTDGYSITAGNVFSTPAEVTDILVDGASVGVGGTAPVDGQKHTVKFIASSMSQKQYIGGVTNKFHGTIYSAKLTDLATPSNSIKWKIDSGPPSAPGSIPDGTVYQDSETHGTLPDIMRPDDWTVPPSGITVSGRTATFDGTQAAWKGVNANLGESYSGLHFYVARVFNLTQGGVQFGMESGDSFLVTGNGVYALAPNAENKRIRVNDKGNETERFIGSVEIISVRPVPQGLIMWNVVAEDWEEV